MIELLPKQREFIKDRKTKYLAYLGGYGAGKTLAGCIKALTLSLVNPNTSGMLVSPTYQMSRDILIKTMIKVLNEYNIRHVFKSQEKKIIFDKNEIWFRSADNPEHLKGGNLAWVGLDEAGQMNKKVWEQAVARARDPEAKFIQVFAMTTPEGYNYLYDLFGTITDEDFKRITASTEDNYFLGTDYVKGLRKNYDSNLQKQYIDGDFVNITAGKVYYGFDRNKHLTEIEIDYNYPLIVCCDFNINPCAWVLCQFIDDKIFIVDELTVYNANTNIVCETLKEKQIENYPALFFYGDYTSLSQRTTATSYSDWQIIDSHFKNYRNYRKKLKANPKVKDSVNLVNNLFDKNKIFINKKCVNIIRDFEKVVWSDNQREIEKKKNTELTHWSDAFRYYVSYDFNINPTYSKVM